MSEGLRSPGVVQCVIEVCGKHKCVWCSAEQLISLVMAEPGFWWVAKVCLGHSRVVWSW